MSPDDTVQRVLDYHRRSKHHVHRYARSLGYLDWAQQPKPFRRYEGAPLIPLMHPPVTKTPYYDELFGAGVIPAAPIDLENLSRLFYDSLAISAWKQVQGAPPWSLRVNPSSGDLHPTEAYLVCGPVAGLFREPGVFHYGVFNHALERRYFLTEPEWGSVAAQIATGSHSDRIELYLLAGGLEVRRARVSLLPPRCRPCHRDDYIWSRRTELEGPDHPEHKR